MTDSNFIIGRLVCAGTLMLALFTTACIPWGSGAQAVNAQAKVQEIEQSNSQALLEIEKYLDRYTSHPGVKILVDQMYLGVVPVFPLPPTYNVTLSPHYGRFKEASPGVFELVEIFSGPAIYVTYLDGTNLGINLQFKGTLNNELSSFNISGSIRLDYVNNIDASVSMKGLQTTSAVEGIYVTGSIKYQRPDNTIADLNIRYQLGGQLIDPCRSQNSDYARFCDLPVPEGGEYIRGRYVQINERLPNDDFKSSLVMDHVLFRPSDQAGVWLAKQAAKRVSNYRTIFYDKGIKISDVSNLVMPGVSEYQGSGSVTTIVGGLWPTLVALTTGGPYSCDLNNPSTAGTGIDIGLKWANDYIEPTIPSLQLTCADLVWRQ